MIKRWLSILFLLAVAWLAVPGSPAAAEHPLELTADLKSQLAELEILRGARIDPPELGNKVILVSFFASWCVPCRKGFGEQGKLINAVGPDNVKVIAINWLEDVGRYPAESMRLTRLLDRIAPQITVLAGNRAISRSFGDVTAIPTVFVFDGSGRALYRFRYSGGNLDANADYEQIARAIASAQIGGD